MGIIDNGTVRNKLTDPFNDFYGKIGIEIRGSSSQMFPKKQYGIEIQDDAGEGVAASLLGMPEEEDWVLFAPYNDKSLMRDVLAYGLGRQLGGVYAPRTRYCEVVLNDVYQGVYVLIEKIKRDKNRVDINKLDPDETAGNDVTGGYIFKIDKTTGDNGDGWTSAYPPPRASGNQTIFFQYEYPDAGDIVQEQKTYLQNYVKMFEDALKSSQFAHPEEGYAKYIDVNSFIDFYLMQELTYNVDGYRLSTFLYKKRDSDGGKIHMGPIWDFNLGFGNANYCSAGVEGWVTDFNKICGTDYWLIPFWWNRLFQDPDFGEKVAARWIALRATSLQKTKIMSHIDSVTTLLNTEAQQRNFTAWKVLNKYIWPNSYIGVTYQDEVNYLKQWVSGRLDWLDENMPLLVTAAENEEMADPVIATPNPFSGEVKIAYSISHAGMVSLRICDALGRTVDEASVFHQTPGRYTHTWSSQSSPGIYFYNIKQGVISLGSGKLSKH